MTRRLLSLVPTVLGVAVLVFAVLHAAPGDPVEIMLGESASPGDLAGMRRALGLDLPLPMQLVRFVARAAVGDLGDSIAFRAPVVTVIGERLPATLLLAGTSLVTAVTSGVALGMLAALRRRTVIDHLARWVSLLGVAMPSFVLGPVLVLVFAIDLRWFPVSGRGNASSLVLPTLTLALGMIGVLTRLTRTAMLSALGADHLRTARAKGASPARVAVVHALRTALPPIVTVIGLQAGGLLAGAIVTETIFAWPGIGRLLVQAIGARDYPLVQGCTLVIGTSYVAMNLATDLLLTRIDPRLRHDA